MTALIASGLHVSLSTLIVILVCLAILVLIIWLLGHFRH